MDIAEERIKEIAIYDTDSKISNRKNLFEIFKATNEPMNTVTIDLITCGKPNLDGKKNWSRWTSGAGSHLFCKKDKHDSEKIPVTSFDVISAFDLRQEKGLTIDHTYYWTNQVMYPLGISLRISSYKFVS